ncbi:MAG: DUF6249 domain-containing protein [bacterium]
MSEDVLIPLVVVPTIFFSIFAVIKTISDNNLRRKIVDKGMVDEHVKHLFQRQSLEYAPVSLKWGMVLIGVGASILIGQVVPYSFREEATISAMFILSGSALILYYVIAAKLAQRNDRSGPNPTGEFKRV